MIARSRLAVLTFVLSINVLWFGLAFLHSNPKCSKQTPCSPPYSINDTSPCAFAQCNKDQCALFHHSSLTMICEEARNSSALTALICGFIGAGISLLWMLKIYASNASYYFSFSPQCGVFILCMLAASAFFVLSILALEHPIYCSHQGGACSDDVKNISVCAIGRCSEDQCIFVDGNEWSCESTISPWIVPTISLFMTSMFTIAMCWFGLQLWHSRHSQHSAHDDDYDIEN